MKKFVVDASVALKWYAPENHSEAAARLLSNDFILCAPDLIGPEFTNALWKKCRRKEISREEVIEILAAFVSSPIEIVPSRILLPAAFEFAVHLDHSVYDCVYLALSVMQACPVVTADRRFYDTVSSIRELASHVRWIADPPSA